MGKKKKKFTKKFNNRNQKKQVGNETTMSVDKKNDSITAKSSTSTVKSTGYVKGKKVTPCHIGPVEIAERLYVGSFSESIAMAEMGLDVLVPLDRLDGDVWETGWRKEILYVPIVDYGIIPRDVLVDKAEEVVKRLRSGKTVGVFCIGGHGRTGYFVSIILGLLGVEDPVGTLRKKYCEHAVETNQQLKEIAAVLEKPWLIKEYEMPDLTPMRYGSLSYGGSYGGYGWYGSPDRGSTKGKEVCGDCYYFYKGVCDISGSFRLEKEKACDLFDEYDTFNYYGYGGI